VEFEAFMDPIPHVVLQREPCVDPAGPAKQHNLEAKMSNFLIYGANGYTGSLIARSAAARGHRPILAGRRPEPLERLADELAVEHRVFALDEAKAIETGIRDVSAVLHCAGPFVHTSRPIAEACLRTGVHYLDITGEAAVFESLAARDQEAKAAKVMLLPGVGFDVVPSDCLAAHLKRRLPTACRLALGFVGDGRVSRGTAITMVENMTGGGLVREEGVLRRVPAAWKTRMIDFGAGPTKAITIPWGDVATAFHSTGIPNIEVYTAASLGLRVAARASRHLGWLLGSSFVQRMLKRRIRAGPPGPTDQERASGTSFLWGEVEDATGQKAVSRLRGPDGYTMTVRTALAIVQRVLAGEIQVGFQTPSRLYGSDFILSVEGIVREDE
jgi:short subunit dehydrogenase-like uncharacterized protein